jgi:F-type H+-transporting ATPase subunit delta
MSATLVAQRYARALAESIQEPEALDMARVRMERFAFLCREYAELYTAITNPAIVQKKRETILKDLLDLLEMSGPVQQFCLVLFRRHRFNLLHEVVDAFSRMVDELRGRIQADVTSAATLNEEQRSRLEQRLAEYCERSVQPVYHVDPDLIGGVVVRLNGTVLDGSLRAQLERLRDTLLTEETNA